MGAEKTRGALPPLALMAAVCVGNALSHTGTTTMPFQVGALIDTVGATPSRAGLLGAFEVGALALSMIAVSQWLHRFKPMRVALLAGVLIIVSNAALFWLRDLIFIYAAASVAGIGYGLLFSATIAGASASTSPDRLFAIGNTVALPIVVTVLTVIPFGTQAFGGMGAFMVLALAALLLTPVLGGLRSDDVAQGKSEDAGSVLAIPGIAPLMVLWATFSFGTAALWTFAERIATAIGIAPTTIGVILSAGTFTGMIGTVIAAKLGGNVNRAAVLKVGLIGTALSCLLLGYAQSLVPFVAGVVLYWVFYMFLYSYLLGTAAIVDPRGRAGSLGGGTERLAFALGAAAGGVFAEHLSYGAIGVLGFAGCMVGFVYGIPQIMRVVQARPS